ncbi:MAG: hypothetical protein ABSB15_04500 [Bryobacteraceae bacterium]|jgi:hypothetical protein
MRESRIHFHWEKEPGSLFRTGVSIHSHTLHSRESLDFIHRATANTPWLAGAIRKQEAKYRAAKGRDLDLKRAWWTPPLSPRQSWDLERNQIEQALGMDALVSITDHDNIDACLNLQVIEATRECPISVEWTVPFRQTFFHIGVHNLPPDAANAMMREMEAFTAAPMERRIKPMLAWLGAAPASLIVLNHPVWDENHIGEAAHRESIETFLGSFRPFIHALELNGLRPWKENRQTAQLAGQFGLPVISGGDRHGREPNACINLTNAGTFAEFVDEVRLDGWSDVLFMPHYREPLKMRILENMCGILEDDPQHALGWVRWSDRVFYRTDEGIDKSLSEFFNGKYPAVVNRFVGLMRLVKHRRVRSALRVALNEDREFAL